MKVRAHFVWRKRDHCKKVKTRYVFAWKQKSSLALEICHYSIQLNLEKASVSAPREWKNIWSSRKKYFWGASASWLSFDGKIFVFGIGVKNSERIFFAPREVNFSLTADFSNGDEPRCSENWLRPLQFGISIIPRNFVYSEECNLLQCMLW